MSDLLIDACGATLNTVAFAQDCTRTGLNRLSWLWTGLRHSDAFPFDTCGVLTVWSTW